MGERGPPGEVGAAGSEVQTGQSGLRLCVLQWKEAPLLLSFPIREAVTLWRPSTL